ncbi:hypothetical protein [Cellulomonas xiejunii]|uniref:Uncharacterized protein n=1 Tax=Cellulomonas xiejunii TaxID=2968083 RepID=A0ABY5KRH3_9CELL|nr:hypothetical protein [Cellulomonas xiejunii]MCC2321468.1 hypothetical protein [Cellulomonas xiejunii]MCC2323380.1 hypothetical protein [Cellulomonas xiejunii]UUI72041.1 hypothetical protein NP048_00795 [Cellulomonas xiejunii]
MRRPAKNAVPAGRRVLQAITRTGFALCVPAGVVGFVLLGVADAMADVPGDTPQGEAGFLLLFFGLFGPFGFWCAHLAVEQWVDGESGRFYGGKYSTPVTVAGTAAFGLLSLGLFTMGLSPVMDFLPDEGGGSAAGILILVVGSILLSILVAAVAGGIALFGWRGAVVGVVFGVGFALAVLGPRLVGVVLLVLGTGGFYGLLALARTHKGAARKSNTREGAARKDNTRRRPSTPVADADLPITDADPPIAYPALPVTYPALPVTDADITDADITDADVTDADVTDADVADADLPGAGR